MKRKIKNKNGVETKLELEITHAILKQFTYFVFKSRDYHD